MTPAERQRRHRDIVTQKPMTKSEREDLQRLVRNREKVMKTAATQRSAELLAEFEQQLASVYHWDQDAIWKQAHDAAAEAVKAAAQTIEVRCEGLGIPVRFAPTITCSWHGRGENALRERRNELRSVARSRIASIERSALTQIERHCLDAQTQILAHGLTSGSAIAFFDALPEVETLMPPLEIGSIEDIVRERTDRAHHSQYLTSNDEA